MTIRNVHSDHLIESFLKSKRKAETFNQISSCPVMASSSKCSMYYKHIFERPLHEAVKKVGFGYSQIHSSEKKKSAILLGK